MISDLLLDGGVDCRSNIFMLQESTNPGRSDGEWADFAASLAVDELLAGGLIAVDTAEFARRIISQQIEILLISNCRPTGELDPSSFNKF